MLPKSIQKVVENLSKLPGIGKKTAQRYAYFLLRSHKGLARELGDSLMKMGEEMQLCTECYLLSDSALCIICKNMHREKSLICVVESVFDAEAIERSGEFKGVYHVLHGRISPLEGTMPDDLKIPELISRIEKKILENEPLEIILATNPSSEGEATAIYLHQLLKPLGVSVTRIATGIPIGADLEYADEVTLARAMKGRHLF